MLQMMRPVTISLVLLLTFSARSHSQTLAVIGATVIHPNRDGAAAISPETTVIVSGDRIVRVGPSDTTRVPRGAKVISGKNKWVIPGLIDSHVHFFQSGNLYTRPDAADLTKWVTYAQETARNRARLPATFKVWLASGVTGVADVGGPFWNFEVRSAARGSVAAPRVVVAGPLISMVSRPQLDLGDPPIIQIKSPDAARQLVRRQLARKPDFIKVWFIHRPNDDLAAQEAIVKAAGDAAHGAGVRLAVHATELETAKAALRAGADLLVHSVADKPVDAEFIQLAKRNNALYTPTLFVGMGYGLALSGTWRATDVEQRLADPQILQSMGDLEKLPKDEPPVRVRQLLSARAEPPRPAIAMANLRKVWESGIPVVMGTDAGNIGTLHGPSVFREMKLMAESGLTPLQVLRTATTNGAKTLGMEKDLGAVAPGRLADLVILEADPLLDVGNTSRIYRVVKGGRIFDPSELMKSIR